MKNTIILAGRQGKDWFAGLGIRVVGIIASEDGLHCWYGEGINNVQ